MNKNHDLLSTLTGLGLNQLEAEVYCELLVQGPGTGYSIGKRIGKATANVYKAIDALTEKGALVIEEGGRNRLCRALSADAFLANLEAQFQKKRGRAQEALAGLEAKPTNDERIYRFESADAVIAQAKAMLAGCKQIVVLDVFPKALEAIRPEVVALAERGKRVFVQTYAPADLPGCELAQMEEPEKSLSDLFEGEQLNVVVDGEETLLALLSPDLVSVRQAVWSKSVYLSFLMHVGLMREHNVQEIMNLPENEVTFEVVSKILAFDDRFSPIGVPGFKTMMSGLSKFFPQDIESMFLGVDK